MKYKVVDNPESYITLGDLKNDIKEFGASQVRIRCSLEKDNVPYKIVFCKGDYCLINLETFSLVYEISSKRTLEQVIEELLTDGYEIIYEK